MSRNLRERNGRFAVGNPGGPGRPPIAKESQYAETLASVCCDDDWKAICERAVKDAKQGDSRARDWLTKYLVGEPQTSVLHGQLHAHLSRSSQGNAFEKASGDAIIGALVALDRVREESKGNNSGDENPSVGDDPMQWAVERL